MSDTTQGGAAASAEKQPSTFLGGLPPGAPPTTSFTPAPDQKPPAEPKADEKPPADAKPDQKAPEPERVSMAESIRELREARQARARDAEAAKTKDQRIAAMEAEIEALKRSQAFEDDPVGYGKARKWTPEQQALYGQSLLYDLAPDRAPPDIRQKLFESRHARKEREAAEAAEAERVKQAQAHEAHELNRYVTALGAAAKTFEAGSHPESEAWFGDDHESYVRSMLATANNLAESARSSGQVADLSPGAVARALELEVSSRMKRRDERAASRTKKPEPAQPASGTQPAGQPASTKGLGAGTPRPAAKTDEERAARAAEALFGVR